MAKRRRRRLWYEVTPRDPRLWLYGPVPSGFWELAENRQRYVEWLGEQLGFTQLEDWYRITRRHFRRHRGGGLLGRKFPAPPAPWWKTCSPTMTGKSGCSSTSRAASGSSGRIAAVILPGWGSSW